MPVLKTSVDPGSEEFAANLEVQSAAVSALEREFATAIAGGGEKYIQRHRDRGRLLARERIEKLLDPDSHFLELSTLAAWGTQFAVGAAIVTGVGVVEGVECMIIAHDPTVRGGTMNPLTLRKNLRALESA